MGSDGGHRGLVLCPRNAGTGTATIAGDHRRFVGVRHRNRERVGPSLRAIGYHHTHVVDVVSTAIDRVLEVRCSLEAQNAAVRVDLERCRISAIRNGEAQIARLKRVVRRHGRGVCLVLGHADVGMILGEHLGMDREAVAFRHRATAIVPRDGKAAVVEPGNGRVVLVSMNVGIDQKLATDRRAVSSEQLSLDARSVGIAQGRTGVDPRDCERAVGKIGHGGTGLVLPGLGVDKKLAADSCAILIKELRLDAGAISIA